MRLHSPRLLKISGGMRGSIVLFADARRPPIARAARSAWTSHPRGKTFSDHR
jgi:hypothetical protein